MQNFPIRKIQLILFIGHWDIVGAAENAYRNNRRFGSVENRRVLRTVGRVAEWFKAAVLKTAVGESPPWVRIPPLPPMNLLKLSRTTIQTRKSPGFPQVC